MSPCATKKKKIKNGNGNKKKSGYISTGYSPDVQLCHHLIFICSNNISGIYTTGNTALDSSAPKKENKTNLLALGTNYEDFKIMIAIEP